MAKFEIWQVHAAGGLLSIATQAGQWRWRLRGANGEILASGESYRNKADCITAVNLVMDTSRQTKFVEVTA